MDIDFNARYSVAGYGGVAFYLRGYAQDWIEPEAEYIDGDPDDESSYVWTDGEYVDNPSMVRAVMVGDDYEHLIDVDDLTVIGEDDYCPSCGQIGCGWH